MQNKNFIRKLLAIIIAGFAAIVPISAQTIWDGTAATNWTGSGIESNPYLITTAQQLAGIAAEVKAGNEFEGKYFKLANDLYLSDPADNHDDKPQWTAIGQIELVQTEPGEWGWTTDTVAFRGTFDGAGYTVHNLYYNTLPDYNLEDPDFPDDPFGGDIPDFMGMNTSLFGCVWNGAVKNLNLADISLTASESVGGLVSINIAGHISHCTVSGTIGIGGQGGVVAGLVGENYDGIIENCSSSANVYDRTDPTYGSSAAGLVGRSVGSYAVIRNSHATGNVTSVRNAAGLAYHNQQGLIENCYATGKVSSTTGGNALSIRRAAGFVGSNEGGTVTRCYATGYVSGQTASGFVATTTDYCLVPGTYISRGIITDCYATGDVYSEGSAAAFVLEIGYTYEVASEFPPTPATIINCFATGAVTYEYFGTYHWPGFTMGISYGSDMVNCYYVNETYGQDVNDYQGRIGGSFVTTLAQMQTQAFVDTLNMVAALFGLSTWEYRAGQLPRPTGIPASNITDYFDGGNGSEADPWQIKTKTQLENFAVYVNRGCDFRDKYVKMTANIALNPPFAEWGTTMPTQWKMIGLDFHDLFQFSFSGTFDGGGHEVSNLYMDSFDDSVGFFKFINRGAVIRNLGVVDAKIWSRGDFCSAGILVGATPTPYGISDTVTIYQCRTSGDIEAFGTVAGIIGTSNIYTVSKVENSYSTANITNTNWDAVACGIIGSSGGMGAYDLIENTYFAGTLTTSRHKNAICGSFSTAKNAFCDSETTGIEIFGADGKPTAGGLSKTTAEMQSRELVDILNDWVSQQNEEGTIQYRYWQHNEGAYPTWTANTPPHSVSYNSNGGSPVTTMRVFDASKITVRPAPTKDGNVFAGWYADNALNELFDFDTQITGNTTLYAKWVQPFTPDLTPFNNSFATTYIITTKEQLAGFALAVNGVPGTRTPNTFEGKTIKLGNDILVNDTTEWKNWGGDNAFALQWIPIGTVDNHFKGTFEGDGYKVSGVYKNALTDQYGNYITEERENNQQGLFGYVGAGGTIQNVGVTASFFRGANDIGGLAGNSRGTITNCYSNANVIARGNNVGGLIGINMGVYGAEPGGTITKSYATGNASGLYNIGGLVGSNGSDIIECYATGNVSGTQNVGGLSGENVIGNTISNSYARGNVTGTIARGGNSNLIGSIGGLTGYGNRGTITNCYVTGYLDVVINGISTGAVIDGLGRSSTTSYFDTETTGQDAGSNPRTTMQMKQKATYENWDFDGIWGRNNAINDGYPYLRWTVDGYVEDDEDLMVTVAFISEGSSEVPVQQVAVGTKAVKPADPVHSLTQTTFGGWFADEELTVTFNFNNFILSDTIIYAKWTFSTRPVTFESNGGSEVLAQTVLTGTPPIRPEDPVREHYTFGGWYQSYQFTGVEYDFVEGVTGYGFTLYAKWIADQHTVTFETNGGNTITPVQLDYGTKLSAPVPPTKADNIFAGWYSNEALTEAYDFNTLIVQDITLYAKWTERAYLTLPYTNNITTAADVSDWTLNNVTWDSGNDGQLLMPRDAYVELPLIPAGMSNYDITVSAYRGRNIELYTSFNGIDYTGQGAFEGSSRVTESTKELPDGIRYVKMVSTTSGVTLVSLTIAPHVNPVIPVIGVTLDKYDISLTVGGARDNETEQLTALVLPTNATNKNVSWESSDRSIAEVTQDGLVTAKREGTAVITVTTENGGFSDMCYVTVSPATVTVSGVELNKSTMTLSVGDTEQLTATVYPSNATNKNVSWESSNRNIAEVNQNGLITAISKGNATIIVTTEDGGYRAECEVAVTVPVTDVSLNKTDISLVVDATEQLTLIIQPSNADYPSVSWESSNRDVAEVSQNGLVTAVSQGTTTIVVIVTTEDSEFLLSCNVTVSPATVSVTGVQLSTTGQSLQVGDRLPLTAMVYPTNATNRNVTWSSSAPSVADVSQSGLVTALSQGAAVITVTTVDDGYTATCNVTVSSESVAVTGIELNKETTTLLTGATEQLTATVLPTNATNQNVTWSTGAWWIANVDQSGLITASSEGIAIITVTTEDGSYTAQCIVTVTESSSIDLAQYVGINIYPNPVKNYLFIHTDSENIKSFAIISVQGMIVKKEQYTSNKVDVSQLPEGIYFLVIKTGNGEYQQRFIKK